MPHLPVLSLSKGRGAFAKRNNVKFVITKNQINEQPEQFMRRAGYGLHRDRHSEQDSFIRRLGSNFYPRLHVYIAHMGEDVVINLHLDQKRPRYQGAKAHNAEYDGEVVEREIARLKSLIKPMEQDKPEPDNKNKGFLNRLFGDRKS